MALPQDTNFLINRLRDSYLQANNNDITKRIIKPYLSNSHIYDAVISTDSSHKLEGLYLDIVKDHTEILGRLKSQAESPPIQTSFYENIRKKHDADTDSSSSDSSEYKNKYEVSLDSDQLQTDEVQNNMTITRRTRSTSSSKQSIESNGKEHDSTSRQRFAGLRKSTYRTSFGKFFKGSTGSMAPSNLGSTGFIGSRIKEEGTEDADSDSSDDDSLTQSMISGSTTGSIDRSLSSMIQETTKDGALIVDDKEDSRNNPDEELMMNIDHEENSSTLSSGFGSFSNDESLVAGSFTDNDDTGIDIAFERAASLYNKEKQSDAFTLSEAASKNGPQSFAILSDNSLQSLKPQAFELKKPETKKPRSNSEPHHQPLKKSMRTLRPDSLAAESMSFPKKVITPVVSQPSKLTMFYHKANTSSGSLLSRFEHVSGDGLANRAVFTINVYIPSLKQHATEPLEVKVKRSSSVFEVLGYILFKYEESLKEKGAENKKLWDLNKWKLQLSDEGEIFEEGFGVLDRTETIDKYQPDEVSLIEVGANEAKANSVLTPLPYTLDAQLPQEAKGALSFTNSPEDHDHMSNTLTLKQSTLMPLNGVYISPNPVSRTVSAEEKLNFKVFLYPDTVKCDTVSVNRRATVDDIIKAFCNSRKINASSYQLQSHQGTILDNSMPAEELDSHTELQLALKQTPKKFAIASSIVSPKKSSSFIPSSFTRSMLRHRQSERPAESIAGSFADTKLKKYTVWRRQQMKFISKHEKQLVFDGEYVYILPPETSTVDVKQSSFHASQIVRVKQSSKYASNFKIIIKMKNDASKYKRYDFEAPSSVVAHEIVEGLKALMRDAR